MSNTSADPVPVASGVCIESLPQEDRLDTCPRRTREFSLDDVDVQEQQSIQAQLSRHLDLAFECAVEEAIRRSLSETASEPSGAMEGDDQEARESDQTNQIVGDMDTLHLDGASGAYERPVFQTSTSPDLVNGLASGTQNHTADSDDADDEEEAVPRSRRSQFRHSRSARSEGLPSFERINGHQSETQSVSTDQSQRRPSLDRIGAYQSERRPSLDRVNAFQAQRRPSLERMGAQGVQRRPSLERAGAYGVERRPSLERAGAYGVERRPSLERMDQHRRRSVEGTDNRSERRPSLERLEQCGLQRQPSLERIRRAEASVQSWSARNGEAAGAGAGSGQGINTLRPWPVNYMGFPTNWDMSRLPMRDSYSHYCLVQLSPGVDQEYNAITVDFEEAGLRVHKVERIQNVVLLDKFKTEKDHLLRLRPPDFELNERYLYHGTQADRERLCEEGLDARLSFQGCFGRGIYFSDNPRKCMQYANVQGNHSATIVVCRVLLGESKVYDTGVKDPSLKREPEKPAAKGGWRFYDSVQGIPMDYPEFVVYENRRAMIEYIITFEEKEYRPPPTLSSYGSSSQTPSLYKVEPIELPIPEEELDKLYMLGPDTDSDGSCDEHTREVEKLRDNVKRGKAKRLGIPYRPPTADEKRYERLHWKRVCYYSCPPNSPLYEMMIRKKQEEKEARKKRKQKEREEKAKAANGTGAKSEDGTECEGEEGRAVGGVGVGILPVARSLSDTEEPEEELENENVAQVLSNLIADFLTITASDDVRQARRYIMGNDMDLDRALCQFFNET